jgi:hypothetical protein
MNLPAGKGWFIWQPVSNPVAAATAAHNAGVSHVLIKVCDGTVRYPFVSVHPVDPVPDMVSAFKTRGIAVFGWGYVYGNSPSGEANIAIARSTQLGLDGFVVNAEVEYKRPNMDTRARAYMAALRAGLGGFFPIGLSSYRFPTLHRELPWQEFLSIVDFAMPQVYWMKATNPAAQLRRSLQEYRALPVQRPIIPTGASFKEHGWQPRPAEVLAFLDAAQEAGLNGVNFWEWSLALRDLPACWQVIADYPWFVQGEPPPGPLEPLVFRALVEGQNIRLTPTTAGVRVGSLRAGELLEAALIGGQDIWLYLPQSGSRPAGWVALQTGGRRYLERVR